MLWRVALLVALGVCAFRLVTGRWPWQRRTTRHDQALARARYLLGTEAGASKIEILAAHRRRVAMVHPDRGGTERQVHEANEARDLLLSALPGAAPGSGQERP